ncbi:MAG: hypothetical protein UW46_C0006G0034 [Candidatus Yanofskybacteria bacterium GW2011_GWF1_44_227]|uniref:Uncharacterized protein n=1 Tax=Candidatus Yanofskybacteria bacterium GW2011_GWE2_40_11 TaxID=1619033 RepID=A0A0G0QSZ7_9BACT|nr:MAG: hypothetical protein UT69_C0002G0029 [Candidatus Yanofskybacteria bacterium GW2011_GWE1_40_10]KKR40481.1 MAG: hypothetical protein UT75_C0008G0003 [Candidatus Yanofskybacteria bacterium GW2011_GWE2_40_11]KKT15451.1 MAG: hypothetical protein UV97_C0006G0018 [Candidatus Yanofskybacteria bacterium GW2011_GWF2_43_596]KKT53133.1 MAG: hypothetical protein UW46_C0006G0034 [Candidatus Yanofskybacteria bacterium GW2011_GWF1_44_227]
MIDKHYNPIHSSTNFGYTSLHFWRPILKAAGIVIFLGVVILLLVGGVIFGASQFVTIFSSSTEAADQTRLAQAGLETMKKMVGDQEAWSAAIKSEYDGIFTNQSVDKRGLSWFDGYITEADHSID